MTICLSYSNYMVPESVSLSDEDRVDNILDMLLKNTNVIQQIVGNSPEALRTLQKLEPCKNRRQHNHWFLEH